MLTSFTTQFFVVKIKSVSVLVSQSLQKIAACWLAACCCAEGGLKVFLLFPSPSRFVYATRGPRVQRPHYWWNCRRNSLVRTNYYSKYVCRCYALLAGGASEQWLPTSTRGCCFWLLLWDRVASLPQIVMTTAWQLGFLRLPAAITMEWLSKISYRYLLECYILFFISYWYLNFTLVYRQLSQFSTLF